VKIRGSIALKVGLALILVLVGLTLFGCIGIRTSPEGGSGGVVSDNVLFLCPAIKQAGGFGCTAPQTEGKLVAVNTSNGNLLWGDSGVSLKPATPSGGGFGCAPSAAPAAVYGSPAVTGDRVYVADYSGKVYLIYASTRSSINTYLGESIIGAPVAVGERVYVGIADGSVYALNGASLEKDWQFKTGGKVWSTPAIEGDMLYIGSFDKKLYALDASDGTEKWAFETEGAVISTPLVYDDTVCFGSFDRHLYCLDAAGGSLKWKFMADSWFWAKPVIYDGVIYAPCLDGKVYILNVGTGSEVVAAFDLESPVSSSPVLVGDKIIVASEEGKVFAVDASSNQLRLLADIEETVNTPLCASEGTIYVYTGSQNLYALNAESGAKLWSLSVK
jgi:outer membrane protein assembly factor BamB